MTACGAKTETNGAAMSTEIINTETGLDTEQTTDAVIFTDDLLLREDIVNLGSSMELDLEHLIACEPDLILASCGTDRNLKLEASFFTKINQIGTLKTPVIIS